MKIAFLHLSDIHFENEQDWITDKAVEVAGGAISGIFSEMVDAFFIIVSGDITNKGAVSQYEIATSFFNQIRNRIVSERQIPVQFIFVPGNHDCNLAKPDDLELRLLSIEKILNEPEKSVRGNQIYRECLKVQQNFFDFVNEMEPNLDYPTTPEIFYRLPVMIKEQLLIFNCFNTAWLTQLHEKQGSLIMPRQLFPECEETKVENAISVSIYHHPENWFSPNNASEFKRLLLNCSDIVISGHEHERNINVQTNLETGESLQIHRAGTLQDRDNHKTSNFNVLIIDLNNSISKQKLLTYQWDKSFYQALKDSEWIDYRVNGKNKRFILGAEFENKLHSLDSMPILHARRVNLHIEDLFVPPRLQVYSLENIVDGKPGSISVDSKNFFKFIKDNQKVLIYGETLQGKTITSRYLFSKLMNEGVIPILVDGDELNIENLKTIIDKTFRDQYQSDTSEPFKQVGKSGRAFIIDNFGQTSSNQANLQKLLAEISTEFDYVIAVGHTNLRMQQFIENEDHEVRFSDFTHCELKPFNKAQRVKLIQNWVKLANSDESEDSILRQINQHQQTVETACESGIIAPYPSYILGVLNLSESANATVDQTNYGTVGYLYQGLITSKFSVFDEKDLDLQQTYILLGEMAFNSFVNDRLDISLDEMNEIISAYQSEYLQPVPTAKFIEQIVQTQIVLRFNERLKFNSVQLRDFFVADYYSRALGNNKKSAQAYDQIDKIIKTVTYDSHTRILLFLVFKANDKPRFIEQILSVSRIIYGEFETANLETDVTFLNDLKETKLPEPEMLPNCSVYERHEQLESAHEDEDEALAIFKNRKRFLVEYRKDLNEFTKAAITLKMIEVLGQLARSFASTLVGDDKISIIRETVGLGLRFLKSRFNFEASELEELRLIIIELIRHRNAGLNAHKLLERADQIVLYSFFVVTFGVIKKISLSIGHEDLKGSFDKFFSAHQTELSYRMIETAFRLDHYPDPLIERIIELGDELETKNPFMWDVLRNLVANYMNLNSVSNAQNRQKLLHKFKIGNTPNFLTNSEVSERKYLPPKRQKFKPPENITRKKR